VTFIYRPLSVAIGAAITLGTVFLIFGLAAHHAYAAWHRRVARQARLGE